MVKFIKIFALLFFAVFVWGVIDSATSQKNTEPPKTEQTQLPKQKEPEPLTVVFLKAYRPSASHGAIDVEFENTSSREIKHWSITVIASDSSGEMIAKDDCMVSFLRPGETKIGTANFFNTKQNTIKFYEAKLNGVVDASGLRKDLEFYLVLKE